MAATLKSSTEGLYNTMCEALHLSKKQFQLIQGVLPVQSDADGFYTFIDGTPPDSVATLYTSNPINGLSTNLLNIISDAKPSFATTMAQNSYMDKTNWIGQKMGHNPSYLPIFSDLLKQTSNGSSASISFDSETADSSLDGAWSNSASEAGVGFWGTKKSSVSETLNKTASSSRITVNITLDSFAYPQVHAGGWYTGGFFTGQYQSPTKWTDGQTAWDKIFGSKGTCQNLANQVLLVNGYTIVVTSHASYSQDDYNMISSSKDTNVWPFYTSSKHSLAIQHHIHNSDKSITTTITCKPGNLQIMGVGVIPTKEAVQGGSNSRLI